MTPEFWQTIEQSKGDPKKLEALLEPKSVDEIIAFAKEFRQALINLNQWSIWGAGFVMAHGMGDDSFHYFRSWIIGKGREAYETALSSPDDLGKFATEDDVEHMFDNELLEYATTAHLDDSHIDLLDEGLEGNPDDTPIGEIWEEETVYDLFPKLTAQFE